MSALPQRSTFVTVLAWVFIAMSGSGTVISIAQNLMIHALLDGELGQRLHQAPPEGVPPVVAFLVGHAQLFFIGALLGSIATLACSIGLLRRQNWARLGFVGLMLLAIAWLLAGLWIQSSVLAGMGTQFAAAGDLGGPDISAVLPVIGVLGVLFALVMGSVHGWIAWKLLTPVIAAEFRR
ncbi:hypothetical protein [Pseudoxanthomonas daejeonensis]|uniref:Uncharacterized protein n=1 Tax=Pseudoxanthomonas daejeonensis TaxID=266062 RepID=A0ABQ6Z7X8_9GAMM|nr:hypothetical protein [Pseudoxanthomonas daejeonensis]KAF1695049.1 hypothetical protein CSC65_07485 [Pseudoxanthomonas daejeonensis]